jgi:hypothetical protein
MKSKIAEAKRQMQSRPLTIAMSEPMSTLVPVRVAYYDWNDKKVEYIVLSKEAFLTPNFPTSVISSNGKPMTTRTIRANGVNTPIVITDQSGHAHLPLLVQYSVERGGRYYETAYYMSTHPGIVTPEVVTAGRLYVRNIIDVSREQLKAKGLAIQPKIADIAERLATVEHVDHLRFRTEFHSNIYNDIFTLFALNEGQTYRYSVSSAGAGGMVQMIPSTYRIVRARFPGAALMPDFVEGMRDHVNAGQAMLLYMQMTWDDLISRPTINNALLTGIATQEQLMAAGYNSNGQLRWTRGNYRLAAWKLSSSSSRISEKRRPARFSSHSLSSEVTSIAWKGSCIDLNNSTDAARVLTSISPFKAPRNTSTSYLDDSVSWK